jgi:hypothetical protein
MQSRSHVPHSLRMPLGRIPLFMGALESLLGNSPLFTIIYIGNNLWCLRPQTSQPSNPSRDFQCKAQPPPLTHTHHLRYNPAFGPPPDNCRGPWRICRHISCAPIAIVQDNDDGCAMASPLDTLNTSSSSVRPPPSVYSAYYPL